MKKKLFALLLSLTLAAGLSFPASFAPDFRAKTLAAGLSACGGAPQSPGGQSSSTPEDGPKDEVIISISSEPETLDPCQGWGHGATPLVQSTLVEYRQDMSFVNDLAEDYTLSEDGLTWTFRLREGVKFTDGEALTASDVVFTFETAKTSQSSLDLTFLEKVEAPDDRTVVFTMSKPTSTFLNTVATVGIVPEHAYGPGYGDAPIGSGPFKFVQWNKQEQLILEANEDYFLGAPSIKRVELVTIADTSAALLNLEGGGIDAYCDIQTSDYALAQSNEDIKIVEGNALGYEFLQFNTAKAPFDNVKVRQAVAYALDKDALLQGINDNIGTKVDTMILSDGIGYTDKIQVYDYNLEKAKALLAEAGYADGFTCDIHVPSDVYGKYAQVLQNSLREIGITANIKQEELSAFKVSTNGGNYDMAVNGCSFTVMDVFESCGDSIYGPKIGDTNNTFYNNPRVNELFDEALVTVDEARLAELYEEVLVIVSEEVPLVPFIWRVRNITCNKDLNIPYMDPYAFHFLHEWSWNS